MTSLPTVPAKHADFLSYIQSYPETPIESLVKPYNAYDAIARKIFAQEPSHPMVKDNHANIVPIYNTSGSTDIKVRSRDLASETPEIKQQYILPLAEDMRRPNGSSALVPTLSEFQENFAIFTENSLSELDWNNVVAAGSAVVTSALPVPEKYRGSKRGRREYYHDKFAPASDVDLFLYGLTEEQAIEKIKHIETSIRNSILYETTTIRTKNTVTIASQYPTRHVQIVLRIYKSIAEILTGFDVDCSCAAYDGKQVFASPRAVASFITQINQIDLSRRSPSYENRLSKYSHRGFEVFWPQLDRSKVDPSIFERSFARTEGLARLLVLEKLPKATDRDTYLEKRRNERGRPPLSLYLQRRQGRELRGNVKDDWEDEVPEWQEEDQVSSYHTFTIPYGRRFNAKNIEKLLYTKDLLLNAQWNLPKDREVNLHRHPAFFGDAEHVIGDCCGCCPVPITDEEIEVAEEESKTYISGNLTFIKDDPGRQEIGSFNPITETDWTEMAYIGHTERLCQAIVSADLEAVKGFLSDEGSNPDRRDYTGRTPLQLACMSSTSEIVQCLVDKGARLIARMADGKTALHLAASRGNVEIIRILLTKSNDNEEEESKNQELRAKSKKRKASDISEDDEEDVEMRDADDASRTSASFIKIDEAGEEVTGATFDTIEENELDPDIYDINVVAWDSLATPLHLAILNGHTEVVKELVSSFGADVLMPVKIINDYNRTPQAAILNLVLVLSLPFDKAREMSQALLQLGASPAQSDLAHCTPLHYIAQSDYSELFDLYLENDGPALQRSINHLAFANRGWNTKFYSAFMNAIAAKNARAANKLLDMGSNAKIELSDWMSTLKCHMSGYQLENTAAQLKDGILQPIYYAVENEMPLIAIDLLRRGADPNSALKEGYNNNGQTVLDQVRWNIKNKKTFLEDGKIGLFGGKANNNPGRSPILFAKDDEAYIADTPPNSYTRYLTKVQLQRAHEENKKLEPKVLEPEPEEPGRKEKTEVVAKLVQEYELLERELLAQGAKTWEELHPPSHLPLHPQGQPAHSQQTPKAERVNYFRTTFNFKTPVLTDAMREGYRQLFDAAWRGDINTIKALTLAKWGPMKNELPLEIAVTANSGISCLSIAVTQGHLSVAEAIIQILHAQCKRKEPQGQTRFEIDSDAESDDSDGNLNIIGHIVDDQFTHDNIGEVRTLVESNVTPLNALCASCNVSAFLEEPHSELRFSEFQRYGWNLHDSKINTLLEYAVFKNDTTLVEFLLKLEKDCAKTNPNGEVPFTVCRRAFQLAISLGHIECLVKMIQIGAAGLPIAWLSEKYGAKPKEEHLYYPGLSIRGKKRKDWATAGQSPVPHATDDRPPLLLAAAQGNLTATEWFLGTAPARHYMEYLNSHLDDETIQRLGESKMGLEGTVLNWMQTRNNLVLHCAVIARPCEESERLVQYLVNHHPECLEARSASGHTPLSLAFSRGDVNYARILIAGGANQTVRDPQGRNLLHFIFIEDGGGVCIEVEKARPLVDLLDKQLIPSMLLQRAGEESLTPIASWLHHVGQWDVEHGTRAGHKPSEVLKLLLDLGESNNQKQLELLSGSGNGPVHETVRRQCPGALELMLDRRPDLLYRENATGNTPLDRVVDLWINKNTRHAPLRAFDHTGGNSHKWSNVLNKSSWEFLDSYDRRTDIEVMFQLCQNRAKSQPGKRKLVSLLEANEVAKRLATTKCGSHSPYYHRYRRRSDNGEGSDEVAMWGGRRW